MTEFKTPSIQRVGLSVAMVEGDRSEITARIDYPDDKEDLRVTLEQDEDVISLTVTEWERLSISIEAMLHGELP